METVFQIRFAAPGEAAEIAKVIREAFAEFECFYTPEAFAATTPNAGEIFERFKEGAIWIAAESETIIGTVSVAPKGVKLYIRSMAILPAAQGLGAGRKLLNEIENFAVENEFEGLLLYTTPFLTGAIRLYERSGFEYKGAGNADEFFGTPWFEMEKKLI